MKILEAHTITGTELTKMQRYALTSDPETASAQSVVGERIKPVAWLIYLDVNAKGEEQEILSVTDGDKTFATISSTFKREFARCVEVADGAAFEIEVISGTANNGREYVTCRLVWVDE